MLARAFDPLYQDYSPRGPGYYEDGKARMAELDRLIAEGYGETDPKDIARGRRHVFHAPKKSFWNKERIVLALVERLRAGRSCRPCDMLRDGHGQLRIAIQRYIGLKQAMELARAKAGIV